MWQLFRSIDALLYRAGRYFAAGALGDSDPGRGTPAGGPDRPQLEPTGVVVTTAGAGFNPGPVDDSFLPRPSLEGLEAECRYRMAAVAGMPADRGWWSAKQPGSKTEQLAKLDDALDLYNLAVEALRENEESA